MSPREAQMFSILDTVSDGVCPDNPTLARMLGAKSISVPARLIQALERFGHITVDRGTNTRSIQINGKWLHSRKPVRPLSLDDNLAELVAEGATVEGAARALGVSTQRGWQVWRRIRDGLGWQAQ